MGRPVAVPRFQPVRTGNADMDRAQDSIAQHLNDVLAAPLSNSIILSVTLAVGVNAISHGLGRAPQGFFAMAHTRGATGDIADDRDTNPHTAKVLYVHSSTATDANLLVY